MNVYEKFDNHFFDTVAAAIFKGPTQVGKIVVKYTKAGVAHVYLHSYGGQHDLWQSLRIWI